MQWTQIDGVGRVAQNVFSPAELESATGLSVDMQRVWRRRGHIASNDGGRASFTAQEVAAVAVRQGLAKRGISPTETLRIGSEAAPKVLYSALISYGGAADVRGSFERVAAVAKEFSSTDRIATKLTGADGSGRYLWANLPPDFQFADDFAALLSGEQYSGFVLLDLVVIAKELVKRATKPLFFIELSDT